MGILPPSFWNFCGSLRNSTISSSSSLASSTPATSLNVTFLPEEESSFALLLPNDSARLPPVCIWRMKKIQRPTSTRTGAQPISMVRSVDSLGSSNVMRTLAAFELLDQAVGDAGLRDELGLLGEAAGGLERAADLGAANRHLVDVLVADLFEQLAVGQPLSAGLAVLERVPEQDDDHEDDRPEHQGLDGFIRM